MVLAAAVALVVVSVFTMPESLLNLLPEFAPPVVHMQTEVFGLSATEVEQLITVLHLSVLVRWNIRPCLMVLRPIQLIETHD